MEKVESRGRKTDIKGLKPRGAVKWGEGKLVGETDIDGDGIVERCTQLI